MSKKIKCELTQAAVDLAFAKEVRGAKNQSQIMRMRGLGIKRQAAEQIVRRLRLIEAGCHSVIN